MAGPRALGGLPHVRGSSHVRLEGLSGVRGASVAGRGRSGLRRPGDPLEVGDLAVDLLWASMHRPNFGFNASFGARGRLHVATQVKVSGRLVRGHQQVCSGQHLGCKRQVTQGRAGSRKPDKSGLPRADCGGGEAARASDEAYLPYLAVSCVVVWSLVQQMPLQVSWSPECCTGLDGLLSHLSRCCGSKHAELSARRLPLSLRLSEPLRLRLPGNFPAGLGTRPSSTETHALAEFRASRVWTSSVPSSEGRGSVNCRADVCRMICSHAPAPPAGTLSDRRA